VTYLALRIARSALRRTVAHRYGVMQTQVADLHLPAHAGPHPVAVVLHGGYWQRPYGKLITRPLCEDLARRGWVAWNVEYRRLGRDGGGWPATFDDVALAIDHLAVLEDERLDLARVTAVGHSAGGQLALWSGGRGEFPAGAPGTAPRVPVTGVLALGAVCDLRLAGSVASALVGGTPEQVPDRWALADPMRQIPIAVPVGLVHATGDETVPVAHSRAYAAAARAAGADVTLVEAAGGHQDAINPASAAWRAGAAWLQRVSVSA
jgi:acetyl esterase/lipase